MKQIFFIALIAATTGMTSCKKFLEERSQSDIVPAKVEDFGDILHSEGYPIGNKLLQPQLYLMDDDVETYAKDDPEWMSTYSINIPAYTWQRDFIEACKLTGSIEGELFNSYKTYYTHLLKVNVVLQGIDNAVGNENDRDWIKGQAFGLRAFYYFMLVNLYGLPYNNTIMPADRAPGVPLKLDGNVVEQEIPRSTVAEVYAQIRRDLDSSIRLLEKEHRVRNRFFFDHVCAHFLASRVALYQGEWETAVRHADYVLEERPELMDLTAGSSTPLVGKESIETIWAYTSQKETGVTGFMAYVDISHSLFDTYDPKDQRVQQFIFVTPPDLKWLIPSDFAQSKLLDNTDFLNWRTAEAYLNRAEANIELYRRNGDASAAQKALQDLNSLRAKRFAAADFQPWTMMPADQLLKQCREERRRELFYEGHRWFDLRRYGMPPIQHILRRSSGTPEVYELQQNDPQYVLPIPLDALERNRALTQNNQITGARQPK